jgi:acyl carrier protein
MSIEKDVFEIVARRLKFELSDLSLETNLRKDLNADSIDSVEVIYELEDLYEIVIEDEVAEDLQTIGSIIDVITERTNK